jgi:hypothetical protein
MNESAATAQPVAEPTARRRGERIRSGAYWAVTLIVAYEMAAGALWDLLRIEYVRTILTHLGYPSYLLFILGICKLPCAVAILVPRFVRLKEWAYAGAIFNYLGATASWVCVGDGPGGWLPPLVFASLTMASWALRPADRRFTSIRSVDGRIVEWVVPIAVVVGMLLIAFVTLPHGPAPGITR